MRIKIPKVIVRNVKYSMRMKQKTFFATNGFTILMAIKIWIFYLVALTNKKTLFCYKMLYNLDGD